MSTSAVEQAAGIQKRGGKKSKTKSAVVRKAENIMAAGRKRAATIRAKHAKGIDATMFHGEVAGTALAVGLARGYMGGRDSLKILSESKFGGIDLALIGGGAGVGYVLMEAFRGRKVNPHLAAVSIGALAAGAVTLGEDLGSKIKDTSLGEALGFGGLFGGGAPKANQFGGVNPNRDVFITPSTGGRPGVRTAR